MECHQAEYMSSSQLHRLALANSMKKNKTDLEMNLRLGNYFFQKEEYLKAADYFEKAVLIEPKKKWQDQVDECHLLLLGA